MEYHPEHAEMFLSRTPAVLDAWLRGIPDAWAHGNEGPDTWSPFDIVGHLIHGEKTDWIPRARIILEHGESRPFEPFDRFAQIEANRGRSLESLLDEFTGLRKKTLRELRDLGITPADRTRTGIHPDLGPVTLRALLATWVAHDQSHIAQIARVLCKQYREEAGPWAGHIPLMNR